MKPVTINGITLTKADMNEVRDTVIEWRNESLTRWPGAIGFTLRVTTVIAILSAVLEEYPEDERVEETTRGEGS